MTPQPSIPQTFQASDYQHSFQISAAQPSDSPAFRVALGRSTANEMVTKQPGGKRKRGAGVAARARKRTTVASSHAVPAVPGVGPSTNPSAAGPAVHPAFVQTYTSLGSLVEKGSGRTQGASDVWYFVRGLHSIVRLDTLPEKETLCEKRPDSKEFSHLGCRLCTYVAKYFMPYSHLTFFLETSNGQRGKMLLVKHQLFETTSSSNTGGTGGILFCCNS